MPLVISASRTKDRQTIGALIDKFYVKKFQIVSAYDLCDIGSRDH